MRYLQPESARPSFVIIQAVYDTYDMMPIKTDATNADDDLNSQPDGRFVFIGQYLLQQISNCLKCLLSARILFHSISRTGRNLELSILKDALLQLIHTS